jgi:hypothetical protein
VTRALLLLVCLWGCAGCAGGPPSGPFYGDEKYLHFGLDARSEADALIQQYSERGEPLALRIEGEHFTALGFMERSGRATRVRALTQRGIELAIDPEPQTALTPGPRFALLAPPIATTQDADGDGFEEIFIERRTAGQNCVLVYRVRDVGYIDAVPVAPQLFGRERCPNAVADVDDDGQAELIVEVELRGFEGEADHRFALTANPHALARYVSTQEAARAPELAYARKHRKFANGYRLSVEVAALSYLLGQTASDQVAAFDTALSGLKLTRVQQGKVETAHAQILAWNQPEAPPEPSDARPVASELVHHAGP